MFFEFVIFYEFLFEFVLVSGFDLAIWTDKVLTIFAFQMFSEVIIMEKGVVASTADEGLTKSN